MEECRIPLCFDTHEAALARFFVDGCRRKKILKENLFEENADPEQLKYGVGELDRILSKMTNQWRHMLDLVV